MELYDRIKQLRNKLASIEVNNSVRTASPQVEFDYEKLVDRDFPSNGK
jgi:hypothetical protein